MTPLSCTLIVNSEIFTAPLPIGMGLSDRLNYQTRQFQDLFYLGTATKGFKETRSHEIVICSILDSQDFPPRKIGNNERAEKVHSL